MTKLGLIDTGEVSHETQNLSFPEMLKTALLAGVKIDAYAYCQSTRKYPDEKGLDVKGLDDERRAVEEDRVKRTHDFLNCYNALRWRQVLERENDLTAIFIAMDEGVCETRLEVIKVALEKKIPILIKPPLAFSTERAKQIEKLAEHHNGSISLWRPLRFARGVMEAHSIIHGNHQDRKIRTYLFMQYELRYGVLSEVL